MTKPIKRYYGTNEEHYCLLCGEYHPSHGERGNERFKAMEEVIKAADMTETGNSNPILEKALEKLNSLTQGTK